MRLAIFITAMVILSSCQKVSSGSGTTNSVNQLNPDVPDPDPANPPPANPPPANGSFAAFTIPTKTSSKPNPLTGIVFWSDNGKMAAYQNSIALEFKYFSYDEVASGSASTGYTYNWSAVTTFLNQAASRGRHGIVRFRETDPELNRVGLPSALQVGARTALYNEGIPGTQPKVVYFTNWTNPDVPSFIVDFYNKFSAAFDQNPNLAYVQVGFGLWGEYHIDFSSMSRWSDSSITSLASALGKAFPSKNTQFSILSAIRSAFTKTATYKVLGFAISDSLLRANTANIYLRQELYELIAVPR